MAEALTQYKLIVLYMLDHVDFPLTNTQISNFVLEKEYTTYFSIQQAISELVDAELIRTESTHNNTCYYIMPAGKETLSYFPDKISAAIKSDVLSYIEENKLTLKQEISVIADYYKTTSQGYAVRCQIKDNDRSLIDLTIAVHAKEQAEAICSNWKRQNEEVYGYLMDLLMN
ncbi:DUF4364 family protein [Petralouisia muris]|jgi:hypothetical protein|uniref:DUF4364 family protein n=1 Tax=Petralouisia muris TaxID=3032872 RepID=A0AC61S151_9FIRM|nr:DUF4364 family protein [Petralouisia muris]TGY97615.1 DUF4364 family protein [Petralouisia muris]